MYRVANHWNTTDWSNKSYSILKLFIIVKYLSKMLALMQKKVAAQMGPGHRSMTSLQQPIRLRLTAVAGTSSANGTLHQESSPKNVLIYKCKEK